MRSKDFELLMQGIAKAAASKSNDDKWNAYHAMKYLLCSDSIFSGEILYRFEKFNSREKYYFYSLLSGMDDYALLVGQIIDFIRFKKILSTKYVYFFKRGFRKKPFIGWISVLAGFLLGSVFLSFLGKPLTLAVTIIVSLIIYSLRHLKDFMRLSIFQNDLLIKEQKKESLFEAAKSLAESLFKARMLSEKELSKYKSIDCDDFINENDSDEMAQAKKDFIKAFAEDSEV